jgi:hypothetical protein
MTPLPHGVPEAPPFLGSAVHVGHLERVVATKCPKYHHSNVKIEKILGVSVTMVTVSPWISIK